MKTDNFTAAVAQATRDKLLNLAELCEEFIEELKNDSFCDGAAIEAVEYKSRDGFISFNEGGYSVSKAFACGWSSALFHTAKERAHVEAMQARCAKDWEELPEDQRPFSDGMSEEAAHDEFEYSYFAEEYTTLEAECVVFDGGGTVQVSLLAHYLDCPYLPSSKAEVIYNCKHTTAAFGAKDNAAIMFDIRAAYAAA
jgi:hypothetical protein